MGKHVYVQKPLAHSVWEARLMRETARQKGVCTQMGNQGTADSGFRRAVELVRSGGLGEVTEVHVWTNRPFNYWKQAPDIVARLNGIGPDSVARPLGPVPGIGTRAAVQPGLSSAQLARLVGFRHRRARRHGLPHDEPAVHGAPAWPARASLGQERRDQSRDLSRVGNDHLRVPGARQPASGQADMVRRGQ